MPEIGEKLPSFALTCVSARGETEVSLADYAGKTLVLFFYPKDDTPGCTIESIEFTTQNAAFQAADATVLGISADDGKSHAKFIAKHNLGVGLLIDSDALFCQTMGIWKEKNMYGRKYMGIDRTTIVIDGTGVIRHLWRKVKVEGHVAEVLAAVQAL